MRAVFVGAGFLAVMSEWNKERIDALAEELDCSFLHGDPAATDFLFCLTGNDQTNILASLASRSLDEAMIVTHSSIEKLHQRRSA